MKFPSLHLLSFGFLLIVFGCAEVSLTQALSFQTGASAGITRRSTSHFSPFVSSRPKFIQCERQKHIATTLFRSVELHSAPPHQAPTELENAQHDNDNEPGNKFGKVKHPLRNQLRRLTGFSLTASRATLRAITGISLSALYASTLTVTGAWIRQTMRFILSFFPTWFRYFLQPFLILYYMPLFVVKNWAGPTRREARTTHEHFVEGWKHAVDVADNSVSYWPLHLNSVTNEIETDFDEIDMTDAIEESMEIALEEEEISHSSPASSSSS